jgi:RNA polymerase sigma-70 factor, ECF subfamily
VSAEAPCHLADHPTRPLADLLERCARGDEGAFAEFYDATAARAYGLALRVLRNGALAEEVTQEVYLEVWRLSQRYDRARGSAVAWLLTLVHRRAVDRVRATQASERREEAYLRREWAGADADVTSTRALASLESERVRAALTRLPPPQREAISLAFLEGLTYVEVAAVVEAPLSTVKFRIRAGLRRLRQDFEARASPAT